MAEPAALPLIHRGSWTVDDLVRTPDDGQRYEIVDGSLIVSPPPEPRHQVIAARLVRALAGVVPVGMEVVEGVGVTITPTTRILVPDVTVAAAEMLLGRTKYLDPSDVVLAVEVMSPSSVTHDRITKPHLYAGAGIRSFWRVESTGSGNVEIIAYRLEGMSYAELGRSGRDGVLRLDEPFPVEIDTLGLTGLR